MKTINRENEAVVRSRGPRLDSIIAVEDAIRKHSGQITHYQLWRTLPKGMQYHKLKVVLDYLAASAKIRFEPDSEGRQTIVWIFKPDFKSKRPKDDVFSN